MAIPVNITCKEFTVKVLEYILCELDYIREIPEPRERQPESEINPIPFYQRIGKAVTLFALKQRERVETALQQSRERALRSPRNLNLFIEKFTEGFFDRIDRLPQRWFSVVILMFCGVIGAAADFCKELNRLELVEVCCHNMDLTMHSYLEDPEDEGKWQRLFEAADEFATEYLSKYWNNNINEAEEVSEENE